MRVPRTAEPPTRQEFELVDPRTGAGRGYVLLGPTDSYGHPAWSSDGRRLALGTDGALTLLDAATMHPTTLRAQAGTGLMDDVAFSLDGATVLAAGSDGEFTLWDAASGRAIGPPIRVGSGPVYAWFDPHGDVFGYSEDLATKTQRRFTFPGRPAEWLATACAIAGDDLTRNEWARYVGDRPYQRTCM
jgi:WD40 repeat protein